MPTHRRNPQPAPVPLLMSRERHDLTRAVRQGQLHHVRRGVFAPAEEWRELSPWDRYLARVHAVARLRPDTVFSHESACALLGLPVFGDPLLVHATTGPGGTSRVSSGVRVHAHYRMPDVVEIDGLLVVNELDTVVSLARSRPEVCALVVADAALRLNPDLTVDALLNENESRESSRGRRRARWPLSRAVRDAESPLESVSRAAVEWLGFAAPQLQVWFGQDRCDMWWESTHTVGEADGELKYDGSLGDPVTALRARADRDARLRREARAIAHWGWSDVVHFDRLRGILIEAGVPRVAPADGTQLMLMQRSLRRAGRAREAAAAPREST